MDHIRIGKDISVYQYLGSTWVKAHSGGVSTFSRQGWGKNWWELESEYEYPDDLLVINDHGTHYSWEPNKDMPLSTYKNLLATVNQAFTKVS
jgi:hypothetical protein